MTVVVVVFLISLTVGALVGRAIGAPKGRATAGFWLGLFLGFVGWIIVALMEPTEWEQRRRAHNQAWALAQAVTQERALGAKGGGHAPLARGCTDVGLLSKLSHDCAPRPWRACAPSPPRGARGRSVDCRSDARRPTGGGGHDGRCDNGWHTGHDAEVRRVDRAGSALRHWRAPLLRAAPSNPGRLKLRRSEAPGFASTRQR